MRKIGVIGGGSSYTPELLEGLLARREVLKVTEVVLADINAERLEILGALGTRMAEKAGASVRIRTTLNPAEAVEGASFVITQFRAGGMAARIRDEKLGLRHNLIGQETTGVGGFAKALRTIPILLSVAREMEKSAPGGWLINFTNPAGIITEAALKHSSVPVIGLCNIPIGYVMAAAKELQADPATIRLDSVGLNHLSWVRGLTAGGMDCFAEFREAVAREFEEEGKPSGREMARWTRYHGLVPNYYLQYYYCTQLMLEELRAKPKTRGEEVVEVERTLFEKYRDPNLREKPKELEKRGGAFYSTAAINLIESLLTDKRDVQVVNVRNNGTVPELPPEVAIEVPCEIRKEGPVPLPQRPLEPEIRGLLQVVKAYEELTVEAGAKGDRRAATLALSVHPLVRRIDLVEKLVDEVLDENREFLPAFAGSRHEVR
ncbi:MAG: 6-phospho-beta-glucosidase [Candidatus Omnitrophica bacterium]|nr:6-phospho-beta-glucosidase [Candidatus Omnitrophota bacterium]